jgi:hypothetical protein
LNQRLFISSDGLLDNFENLSSDLISRKLVWCGFVHVDLARFVGESFAGDISENSVLNLKYSLKISRRKKYTNLVWRLLVLDSEDGNFLGSFLLSGVERSLGILVFLPRSGKRGFAVKFVVVETWT